MELVQLGHSSRAHGIKGELQLRLFNEQESILDNGIEVILKPKGPESTLPAEGLTLVIENIRFGNRTIVSFEKIKDRTQAEQILPLELYIDRALLPDLDSDQVYLEDLAGFKLFDENSQEIGFVQDYYCMPAQDILVLSLKNGKSIDLPFVEQFFPEIDSIKKTLVVRIPEVID
jgi:16S rRNA processing protein RimM